jgi:pilus assembly protein CpaC
MKTVLCAACALAPLAAVPAEQAAAQSVISPAQDIALSIGRGQLVTVPGNMADVFVSNETVADVQVKSQRQLYVFGKAGGETTVYASNSAGDIIWSANVRVGSNLDSIDQMLTLAMPDAKIQVATMGSNTVLLTGTVAAPEDAAEAERLVARLRRRRRKRDLPPAHGDPAAGQPARPVRRGQPLGGPHAGHEPATVRRQTASSSASARDANLSTSGSPAANLAVGRGLHLPDRKSPATQANVISRSRTARRWASPAVPWARPHRRARPCRTRRAGDDPVGTQPHRAVRARPPSSSPAASSRSRSARARHHDDRIQELRRQPGLHADRARERADLDPRSPEVSELSSQGAVTLNGFQVPALTIRRAETTVELGSGQSFMIAGLLSNSAQHTIDKAPGAGDLPILGALFRSTTFQKGQTELVIVVTRTWCARSTTARSPCRPTAITRRRVRPVARQHRQRRRIGRDRPMPSSNGEAPLRRSA